MVLAVVNLCAIVFGGIVSLLNRKKLQMVHLQINGRVDELIAAARREGVLEEKDANNQRQGSDKV